MSLNRICLVGRLTRDPELRTTTTGKSFATFSIAVRKQRKPAEGERDADFFNIKVWGQTADFVSRYLTKGRLVAVDGRIESRKYQDREGHERETWDVVADNVQGLDGPKDDRDGGYQAAGGSAATGSNAPSKPEPAPDDSYDPFAE